MPYYPSIPWDPLSNFSNGISQTMPPSSYPPSYPNSGAHPPLPSHSHSHSPHPPPTTTRSAPKSKRRKKDDTDGRWQKRFVWPEELHRFFVASVFDVGLKSSTPSAILQIMGQSSGNQEVTTERIKSHLQKFRLHRGKSANEFMESYDYWRKRLEEGGGEKEEDAKTDNR